MCFVLLRFRAGRGVAQASRALPQAVCPLASPRAPAGTGGLPSRPGWRCGSLSVVPASHHANQVLHSSRIKREAHRLQPRQPLRQGLRRRRHRQLQRRQRHGTAWVAPRLRGRAARSGRKQRTCSCQKGLELGGLQGRGGPGSRQRGQGPPARSRHDAAAGGQPPGTALQPRGLRSFEGWCSRRRRPASGRRGRPVPSQPSAGRGARGAETRALPSASGGFARAVSTGAGPPNPAAGVV